MLSGDSLIPKILSSVLLICHVWSWRQVVGGMNHQGLPMALSLVTYIRQLEITDKQKRSVTLTTA